MNWKQRLADLTLGQWEAVSVLIFYAGFAALVVACTYSLWSILAVIGTATCWLAAVFNRSLAEAHEKMVPCKDCQMRSYCRDSLGKCHQKSKESTLAD